MPTMNTTGNSRPFAMCSVMSVTAESSSSESSCSPTKETCSRKSLSDASGSRARSLGAATPDSSCRFSIRPWASTVRSSSGSAR